MRVLVTGGSGVVGRAAIPLLRAANHEVLGPSRTELNLFDPKAVAAVVGDVEAILHLATRIPREDPYEHPEAWWENDRLRIEAARVLVDAALEADVGVFVQPSVTFVEPDLHGDVPRHLRSALVAEHEALRFAGAERRGIVLRFGLIDGGGSRIKTPNDVYGATLHAEDAGSALVAALRAPSGVYNVCRDGERVSNERFKRATGWRPSR
jgi:nucleoside-diphosphate-sugar epimerase